MIFGIGVDICEVTRFQEWIKKPDLLCRFFNKADILPEDNSCSNETLYEQRLMEHYASRFAAKEAFGKALGTGIHCFKLTEIYVKKDETGRPVLAVEGKTAEKLKELCGECTIHLSLSHEKNNAIAFAVIEK